ncbi:anhydro-N-acetylmuramic acid kinase [Alteribacter aurantiacus]|uniref:anhydro-N-acetylmuramic acid kinase n=1 Tax=Alteribacter aurantiacus TaxID=254410 RepID=UPI000419202D|nr:anhydro-N-acetylmuramic acid kinase [Alteribacter aurantiacus]
MIPLKKERVLAVGLMSGTSLDGIDAALVEIRGSGFSTEVKLLAFKTYPYDGDMKERILHACHRETSSVDLICKLNVELGMLMAEAVKNVVAHSDVELSDIDFVSSHGQTIHHMPDDQATLQIGELSVIAHETGCVTVGDFRPSDMAVGGQGAPLVPFVDELLFRHKEKGRILANIGGMANLTVLPPQRNQEEPVVAFDTGPGNVLVDAIVRIGSKGRLAFDEGGEIASKGEVKERWLDQLMAFDRFLTLPYPKSTGREYYTEQRANAIWQEGIEQGFTFEDIVATVTAYTVRSIAMTVKEQVPKSANIQEVFVGGGGVHNRVIMNGLAAELQLPVKSMEEVDFSSDAKEAIAFAIFGNEFLRLKPNNTPTATGAKKAVAMGKLALPF